MKAAAFALSLFLAFPTLAQTTTETPKPTPAEQKKKVEETKKKVEEAKEKADEASRQAAKAQKELDEATKKDDSFPEKVTLEIEDIDDSTAGPFIDKIEEIKKGGTTKELWIRIHSFGGVIDSGEKMIDAIENAGIPTVCVADHKAMSMAFYILQACDRRLMTKRTVLMIHEPAGGARGNATQMGMIADYLTKTHRAILEMAARKMDLSVDQIIAKAGPTAWFLTWQEAVDHKAVDGTVDSREIPPTLKVEAKMDFLRMLFGFKSCMDKNGEMTCKENPRPGVSDPKFYIQEQR